MILISYWLLFCYFIVTMEYYYCVKKLERNIIIYNDILHNSGFQSLCCEIL